MKVILYIAQTINGVIARENYDEDFLSDINWKVFVKLTEKIGCFIVGRKTYEKGDILLALKGKASNDDVHPDFLHN